MSREPSTGRSLLLAVLATALAIGVRWLLAPVLGEHLPYVTVFVAVALTAWLGGPLSALVTTVLGFFCALYLFVPPSGSWEVRGAPQVLGLAIFFLVSLSIAGFSGALHRSRRRSEEHRESLRVTLASIGDAVIATDVEGRIEFLNAVAEELTGWRSAEAAGRPLAGVFRIVNEDTRRPVDDPTVRAIREGVVVGLANHTVLIAKDGTERPIDDSAAPIRDHRGRVIGCVLVFRDVTERRRAERALQENERLLATATRGAGVGLVVIGPDGTYRLANDAYGEIVGIAPAELIGRSVADVLRRSWDEIGPQLERAFAGESVSFELVLPSRAGGGAQPRTLAVTYEPQELDGRTQVVAVIVDVTERVRAAAALRDSQQRHEHLVGLLPVAVYTCEAPSGAITFYNEHAATLWGRAPAAGDTDERFCGSYRLWRGDGTLLPHDQTPMARAMREGCSFRNQDVVIERPDGSRIHVLVNIDPLRDEGGAIVGAVNVFHDTTRLKEAENALREADRRKDEFLATLAHELRNPLAPVRSSLEILKHGAAPAAVLAQARDTIDRQVAVMERLIDDLLDVSRITRSRLELRRSRVELGELLRRVAETARPATEQAELHLAVDLVDEPLPVDGDSVRLVQVFDNLLNNACKFTAAGGHVWLTARRDGDSARVTVADDGIGIAPEMLTSIFEMFTQADRDLARERGGLGIGLTIVRQLVELHDGEIEVHSEGRGRGSEFVVRLPLTAAAAGREAEPDGRSVLTPAPSRRVLVVDDNRDGAEALAALLRLAGHRTHTASDGLAALEAAERERPELVLLDIGLPKLDGYDVCRRIRESAWGKEVVVVALTGWGQERDRAESRRAGFDAHLVKPVHHEQLLELLAGLPPDGNGTPAGS